MREVSGYNMTFGEAHQVEVDSMAMVDGVFQATVAVFHKKPRLSKELDGKGGSPAGRHYNKKLEKAFADMMHDSIPKSKRLQAVKYLMYGRQR